MESEKLCSTGEYLYIVLSIDIFHYELRENITFPYISIIAIIIFMTVKNIDIRGMSQTPNILFQESCFKLFNLLK